MPDEIRAEIDEARAATESYRAKAAELIAELRAREARSRGEAVRAQAAESRTREAEEAREATSERAEEAIERLKVEARERAEAAINEATERAEGQHRRLWSAPPRPRAGSTSSPRA